MGGRPCRSPFAFGGALEPQGKKGRQRLAAADPAPLPPLAHHLHERDEELLALGQLIDRRAQAPKECR